MVKLFKKTISMLLVVTCLAGSLLACSNDDDEKETTKEAGTTKEVVQETTTEEPTTLPYEKVGEFAIKEQYADYFNDLVIENGSVIVMNEAVPDDDVFRGNEALILLSILGMDHTEFSEKYFTLGYQNPEVPYEDNYCIEYTGEEKYIFKFSYKDEKFNAIYFDLCKFK